MTTLVLSATGTTGSATVRSLLARGATVRAATRSPATANLPSGAEAVRFDPLDRSTWSAALTGVRRLYLCMPNSFAEQVDTTLALIDAAKAHGVERIVTLSAFRADVITYSPHKQLEAAIEATGLQWVHLRPNFFADNFLSSVGPDGSIAVPAGDGHTSFIAAADIGDAAAEALLGTRTGEVWTLTGPEALSHDEVASILSDVLGRGVAYHDIPAETFVQMLTQYTGASLDKATALSKVYSDDVASGAYAPVFADFGQVLGRPPTSFRQWAQDHADAFVS